MHTTEYEHTSVSPIHLYLCIYSRVHKKYNKQIMKRFCPSSKKKNIYTICFLNHYLNTRHAQLGKKFRCSLIQKWNKKNLKKPRGGKKDHLREHLLYSVSCEKKQTFSIRFFFRVWIHKWYYSLIFSIACVSVWHFISCNHYFALL